MRSTGPIHNPSPAVSKAIQQLNDFSYRKEFGLSFEEFMNEPIEVYMANMDIMNLRTEEERREMKKTERSARMSRVPTREYS